MKPEHVRVPTPDTPEAKPGSKSCDVENGQIGASPWGAGTDGSWGGINSSPLVGYGGKECGTVVFACGCPTFRSGEGITIPPGDIGDSLCPS
jgi:hypothetical protein